MTPLNRRILQAAATDPLTIKLLSGGNPLPAYQEQAKPIFQSGSLSYESVLFRFVGPASVDGYQVEIGGEIELRELFPSPFVARAGDELEVKLTTEIK